jgi:vacuolar protein sorting-associated protein 13A/C
MRSTSGPKHTARLAVVLEGLVASLLNQHLGGLVENLDVEQVRIGVLSGKAVLRGLRLRRDAVATLLGLPVDVIVGSIGSVSLNIPFTSLRSKPVEVLISDISAVIAPSTAVPPVPSPCTTLLP